MEPFRIVNFAMQSSCLIAHALFMATLYRRRQPTPVWRCFFLFCAAAWLWVSGRLMESVVYIFFPGRNDLYQFAANYQYIGDLMAIAFYVLWTLYLTGREKLAAKGWLRALVFSNPLIVCTLVFTNPLHHLFYHRLDMGERVIHGPLFAPLILWSYLMLFLAYALSIAHIVSEGRDRFRRILMFSAFPLLPAIGALVRSIVGVDRLDFTPVHVAAGVLCMYQAVFKYHDLGIISASIREVIEQAAHAIGIWDPVKGELTYANRIARQAYQGAARRFFEDQPRAVGRYEEAFDDRQLVIDVAPLQGDDTLLVTATDVTDIAREQARLGAQIQSLTSLEQALNSAKRDIDAYLDALFSGEELRRKQALIDETRKLTRGVFDRVAENLAVAKRDPDRAEAALSENLELTRQCISDIRQTVDAIVGD